MKTLLVVFLMLLAGCGTIRANEPELRATVRGDYLALAECTRDSLEEQNSFVTGSFVIRLEQSHAPLLARVSSLAHITELTMFEITFRPVHPSETYIEIRRRGIGVGFARQQQTVNACAGDTWQETTGASISVRRGRSPA